MCVRCRVCYVHVSEGAQTQTHAEHTWSQCLQNWFADAQAFSTHHDGDLFVRPLEFSQRNRPCHSLNRHDGRTLEAPAFTLTTNTTTITITALQPHHNLLVAFKSTLDVFVAPQ